MHIYLLGFMGSGKSTVGIALAQKLAVPFYDTDRLISEHAQKSISQLFAEEGEHGFRPLETQALQRLTQMPAGVVATGGGVLLAPENREVIERGFPVVLDARLETLIERLAEEKEERPLLNTADWQASLQTLYKKRMPLYQVIPTHVQTDGKTIHHIVEEIVSLKERP